ncbi:MAG: hypothetical protein AB1530_03270 [Candidatus Omnitrophota bacterium]
MKKILIVVLIFTGLTAAMTFPLIKGLTSSFPGFHSTDEPYGVLWYSWWLKYSSLHGLASYVCPFIAAPFGVVLSQAPQYPLSDTITRLSTIAFGAVTTYNLAILFSFVLAGLCAYFLVYHITKDFFASVYSGVIYSFLPYHFARAWQHPSLAQIQYFPLLLLSLFLLKERNNRSSAILLVLSIALSALSSYYYLYFSLIIVGVYAMFILIIEKKKSLHTLKLLLICMVLACIVLMPLVYPILKTSFSQQKTASMLAGGYIRPFEDLFSQSARPLSYLLPASVHPLFGRFTERFIGSPLYGMSFTEHTLYLGLTPLLLAFIAFRQWRRRRRAPSENRAFAYIGFLALLALIAWLFSQPPWWKIGGLKLYMPSVCMYRALPMFRAYCRFGIVVMLAIAVLAGIGLALIRAKYRSSRIKAFIAVAACAAVLFEFWNYPLFKVINVSRVPAAYLWLKKQPGDFIIAEYPLDTESPDELYKFHQTVHEKRIINGTIPNTLAHTFAQSVAQLSDIRTAATLYRMGVKYVVINRDAYLKTGLIEQREELGRIPSNPALRLVKSFPGQMCPDKGIRCILEGGVIDIYEVTAARSMGREKTL